MPHVDILLTNLKGKPLQRDGGKVEVVDGEVVFTDVRPDLVRAMQEGVKIGTRLYTPKDGLTFLKYLPYMFNGTYVRARYVGDDGVTSDDSRKG